ncbi:MAG: hypothetical protein HYZ71_07335 [Deltaproteobacteria bacterium]|nr:hypothetical protein [Deltaproteobacteria bacterium]
MKRYITFAAFTFYVGQGFSVEIESLKSALKAALGHVKAATKKTVTEKDQTFDIYFDKAALKNYAVVQKRIYPPNCTHTWVIGIDALSKKVNEIRIVEYSCPHAKPATTASYFEQYKGKGPVDMSELKGSIQTVAKATATCDLTTDAVVMAVEAIGKI